MIGVENSSKYRAADARESALEAFGYPDAEVLVCDGPNCDGETATWTVDPVNGHVRCTECFQTLAVVELPKRYLDTDSDHDDVPSIGGGES